MKQSGLLRTISVFPGTNILRTHAFETIGTRDRYTLLAKANHNLAMDFAVSGVESALFEGKDYFECLSPHEIAA